MINLIDLGPTLLSLHNVSYYLRLMAEAEHCTDPHRLDMSWQHWPVARALGVRTAINPDAHSVRGLGAVRYGVNIARKASLTTADVINAWPLEDVIEYLEARKRNRGKAN